VEGLAEVRLQKDTTGRMDRVESFWYHDGNLVLKFAGMNSISEAEPWQHADILVPESELAKPAEGEFLYADLIGCAVYEEGSAVALGTVRGVEDYGSAPLLDVEAVGGRQILIPLAKSICVEIDVARKIIRAKLPEGLTEL
jgi:16S rRNA processing protein RimM